MRITIPTDVQQPMGVVWANFDETLFRKLSPPFPPARLLRFDGCMPGDEVHIELNLLLFKQIWISQITEQRQSPDEIYFVDQGVKLPFFLRYWRHKHRIVKRGSGSCIIEEIEFRTPSTLTDWLFYPILYGQFLYRKPIYRRVFGA
ncbi:MAG: hypothetical protein LH606_19825 [Cytophagaceae bacterium]|nr:hypothetical protein [Cytophagaceae bacterium]